MTLARVFLARLGRLGPLVPPVGLTTCDENGNFLMAAHARAFLLPKIAFRLSRIESEFLASLRACSNGPED